MPMQNKMDPEMEDTMESEDTEMESEDSGSAYLPAECAGKGVKAGDTITLKVVSVAEDGTVEVCPAVGQGKGSAGNAPATESEDPNTSLDQLED